MSEISALELAETKKDWSCQKSKRELVSTVTTDDVTPPLLKLIACSCHKTK